MVERDLRRSRLTVFFRFPLAVVHMVWLALWSVVVCAVITFGWVATLTTGRLPVLLHRFGEAYLRYVMHVTAFLCLAANPFPGFTGGPGSSPVAVHVDPPARQNRWKTAFRLVLALPAGWLAAALAGGGLSVGPRSFSFTLSLLLTAAVLAWFVALVRGAITAGLRDAMWLALAYAAQVLGYVLLLTDRYPCADPERLLEAERPSPRRVRLLLGEDDCSRDRFGVLVRAVIVIPHVIWMLLWGVLVAVSAIVNWVALLILGRAPELLHRLIASYIRYVLSVVAFTALLADEYPPFRPPRGGRYSVDADLGPPLPQRRWRTLFRGVLGLPAFMLASAYGSVLATVAVLGWFASLVVGPMPGGLHKLGIACLNHITQTYAYMLLVCDQYPYSGPAPSWE